MTENQKEFFGEGCDMEAWKKDIETMRSEKADSISEKESADGVIQAILSDANLREQVKVLLVKHSYYQEARFLKDYDVSSIELTEEEKQAIREQGEKAVLSYLEKVTLPSISIYQIGNKVCRNNISCILTEPYIKEANKSNSMYSGIPLTKKELDALGYESDRITFQKGQITIGWYADNTFFYLANGNVSETKLKIEFVHQLQNLETLLNSK